MNWVARAKNSWLVAILVLVALGAAVAWKVESRSTARSEKNTNERIGKEVRDSIGKSTGGVQMCPLSQPDCNKK